MIHLLEKQWHELLRAWMNRDGATLGALLSSRPEATWVGPTPKAFWQGRVAIIAGLRNATLARELATLETQYVDIHVETEWGWVIYVGMADNARLRVSSVWVREADTWRAFLIHADWSETKPSDFLTGAQQTMMTWARLIESPAQLPLAYRGVVTERLDARAPFPYMVLVPSFEDATLALPEQVLFEQNGMLHILARREEAVTECVYPLGEIWSVEMGLVLLQSWITLDGRTQEGTWATTTLAFSTASRALLQPFVHRIRTVGPRASWQQQSLSVTGFDEKFVHDVQEVLLSGEFVLAWLWRPDIVLATPLASTWPFYMAGRVNHLTLLTDREVILMWDKVSETIGEDEGYGMVRRYIPLRHITEVKVREDAVGTPSLALTLGDTITLERLFTVNQRIELEEFVHKIGVVVQSLSSKE